MLYNGFQLFNPFVSTPATVERHIRLRRLEEHPAPDSEFPEAEIDESLRRAAMIRERLRRFGRRAGL
jgi:hypothetical protein